MEEAEEQVLTELQRRQKFKNLTEVLEENNYDSMPTKQNLSFVYLDATKTLKIEWTTVRV